MNYKNQIAAELENFSKLSRVCEGECFTLSSCAAELAGIAASATALRMFAIAGGASVPMGGADDIVACTGPVLLALAEECETLVGVLALYMGGQTHTSDGVDPQGLELADCIEVAMDEIASLAEEACE